MTAQEKNVILSHLHIKDIKATEITKTGKRKASEFLVAALHISLSQKYVWPCTCPRGHVAFVQYRVMCGSGAQFRISGSFGFGMVKRAQPFAIKSCSGREKVGHQDKVGVVNRSYLCQRLCNSARGTEYGQVCNCPYLGPCIRSTILKRKRQILLTEGLHRSPKLPSVLFRTAKTKTELEQAKIESAR